LNLQHLGNLGEFLAAIATLATLIYLALQIKQNTARQKMDASVSIQQGQNNVVGLMQDPMLMRAFARAGEYGKAAAIEDRAAAINWVCQYLNHFQIVYDLYNDGTLDRERYEIWKGVAVAIVAPKGIRQWWNDESGKMAFSLEVRDIIDRELSDTDNPPTPMTEAWSILSAKSWEE
jgi:hypothetical protein